MTNLVTQSEDRAVAGFLGFYVLVCLAVASAIASTACGDDEPVFKGRPASHWVAELKSGFTRGRQAIQQFDPEARDCVPDLIGAFRGEPPTIRVGSCVPP
ncbi:MAG: hypothetical protein HY000_06640 [Planctomycetes bacterium]|nr:hypothetical protein [Planctomycetota bacterium]